MFLFWRIRYLDRQDKAFKNRDLYLDTVALDAKTKAAIELCCELSDSGTSRKILEYRDRFLPDTLSMEEKATRIKESGFKTIYFSQDYFEDEAGKELSVNEVGRILTGNPMAMAIPPGAKQHDIDFMLSRPNPIKIDELRINDVNLELLSYFVRDLRELEGTALSKDGPGSLTWSEGVEPTIHTGVTDEEIRSHLTIFRRLYMAGEPANFLSITELVAGVAGDYPLIKWIKGIAKQYEDELDQTPHFLPFKGADNISFSRKRIIDVFLYTRYAHQPGSRRLRQFNECLEQAGGRNQLLTYLFLTELWAASLHIKNAGRMIARIYESYCDVAGRVPSLVDSVANEAPGIGQLEKKDSRKQRILAQKTQELAVALWKEDGQPDSGPDSYLTRASEQLSEIQE